MAIRMMQKLKASHQITFFLLLVIIFSMALVLFVILPNAREIKEIRQDIGRQKSELEEKYLKGLNAKLISKNAEEIKSNLEIIDQIFVKPEGYLNLVTFLEGLARDNNLEENLNILNNRFENKGYYRIVPIQIETKGKLKDQLNFISSLSKDSFQFDINSLKLRSLEFDSIETLKRRAEFGEEGTSTEVINLDLDLNATSTEPIIVIEKFSDLNQDKNLSLLILGQVYWKN